MDDALRRGASRDALPHSISVVIPVYQGERTLVPLLAEIATLTDGVRSPGGRGVVVAEVVLVHDSGPDGSAQVMRDLAEPYAFVRTVWLSRNFGQHAATLAGMASSGSEWIVTLDEDGSTIPRTSRRWSMSRSSGRPTSSMRARPTLLHTGSAEIWRRERPKLLLRASTGRHQATDFNSYRLVLGEVGRSVAAYAGVGVYLDVALGWVARRTATCPVTLREEGARPSGYSYRSLVSHFWRMVLSSGTRALRLVSLLGVVFAIGGFLLALYFFAARLFWDIETPQGWPSLIVVVLVIGGAVLFSLGVIAEYIGVAVNMAMGKPLYLMVSDAADGPLGRADARSTWTVPPAAAPPIEQTIDPIIGAANPSDVEAATSRDTRHGRPAP